MQQPLEQREAQRLNKILLDYHYTIRSALLHIPATSPAHKFANSGPPPPPPGGRALPCARADFNTLNHPATQLQAIHVWTRLLERRHRVHQQAYQKVQREAAAAADKAHQDKITKELWRHGTGRARELLMHKRQHQQGLSTIRHPTTDHLAFAPEEVEAAAVLHTQQLLGTAPHPPPTNKPWQEPSLWSAAQQTWTAAHVTAATRLATQDDILSLINSANSGSAPGLDGIQYSALIKLLLKADAQAQEEWRQLHAAGAPGGPPAGRGGPLVHMLPNITHAILCSDALPSQLGKSEMVYFHKKGDPTRLGNYRGIALQSVLYKLAAAFTARQTLKAAELLGLLSPAQVAARKHGRAADHVATMTNALADASRARQELHVITSDIQKAFDEVPREALWEALSLHGYPQELIRRVKLLQTCTGVTVRTQYGRASTAVVTTKGCKQGCPLSPVTYCLFMNMFLKGLSADPQCGPYIPSSTVGSATPSHAGLLCQAYMDDLAMFSPTAAQAQCQLNSLDTFLEAYGMCLNAAKCRHTAVNEPSLQAQPPLKVRATQNNGTHTPIPRTNPAGTFEYLGHHINQNGSWAIQEAALEAKLGVAMQQVKLAAGNKACHTLWTAMFTEHDGGSVLAYYMAATGLSESSLQKFNTALAEACRARAFIGEHVARANMFGKPQDKGLGITSAHALEAGVKTSTLLRLLNETAQPAISELAAGPMRAIHAKQHLATDPPLAPGLAPAAAGSRARQPPLNHSHFPALHRTATAALSKHPRADTPLAIVENYKNLGTTPLSLLCPHLHAEARSCKGALRALALLTAEAALQIAQPRARPAPAPNLSEAEEAILQGGSLAAALRTKLTDLQTAASRGVPAEVQTSLSALLVPSAMLLLSRIQAAGKQKLLAGITGALLRELCGPHSYTYATRHTHAYLTARYPSHTPVVRHLSNAHVGVDGSLRPPSAELPAKGGGAAAFVTAEIDQYTQVTVLTAHIATCTYGGEQTVANSEYAGFALALQTLTSSPCLRVGWDHLNAVKLMHAELPQTAPDGPSNSASPQPSDPAGTPAQSSHDHLASAEHYHGNPAMALAHALTADAIALGNRRVVYKVEAHISREADAKIATLLDSAARWDAHTREYTVPDATLRAVLQTIAATLAARPQPAGAHDQAAAADPLGAAPNTHHLSIALNTLADWGSKQVALKNRPPSVALPPNTLSTGKWCLVNVPPPLGGNGATVSSTVQQSDPASVRKLISGRVEQALQEAKLHPDPNQPLPTRLDMSNLWVEESTAVLRRPGGKHTACQAAMPPEPLTKHYCQMAYGSIRYNADALAKDPDLAAANVMGPKRQLAPFTTHCQLCAQPGSLPLGEDSLHHVFHTCTAHAVVEAKEALQVALTKKIREISDNALDPAQAALAADLIMRRPDYYAGQISLDAHNLIAAARKAHTLSQQRPPGLPGEASPAPAHKAGALQRIVLAHSKQIHDIRNGIIPEQLRLTHYRKAMWANQRATAQAAKAAALALTAAAQGDAGDGHTGS